MEFNYLDIAFGVICIFFIARGAFRGAVDELVGLVSIVAGLFFARQYADVVGVYLEPYLAEQWVYAAAFALIFFICIVVVALLGILLENLMEAVSLGMVNNFLGAIIGAAKAYLVCVLVGYVAILFFVGNEIVTGSIVLPYLQFGIDWLDQIVPL